MRVLPWIFWPLIAALVIAGIAHLAETSDTLAGIAAAGALFGTFGMTARDS